MPHTIQRESSLRTTPLKSGTKAVKSTGKGTSAMFCVWPAQRSRSGENVEGSAVEITVETQWENNARKLIDDGQRREDVAALLNVNRTTLYRVLNA